MRIGFHRAGNSFLLAFLTTLLLGVSGCAQRHAPLGSPQNPVKMYFVPSGEVDRVMASGSTVAQALTDATGIHFKTAVPMSYAAVIEAMGSTEADIAWLPTFAYVLAHARHGVDVALRTVRFGESQYRAQIIARTDSGIDSLPQLAGKRFAFTDAASAAGYVYPSALLKRMGIELGETFFAKGHPQVVLAVYHGSADAGATFWSPPRPDGTPGDARARVVETVPDVMDKVKIIGFTDWIPNDTVSFRKDFPPAMKEKIVDALLAYAQTEEGKKTLDALYEISGFDRATDGDYEVVRQALASLGKGAEEFLGK
jgi:phosphonate transport system substrate-binding protein